MKRNDFENRPKKKLLNEYAFRYNSLLKSHFPSILPLIFLVMLFSACRQPLPPQTEYVLGTICTITLFDKGSTAVYKTLFDRLNKLESILSANTDNSNIAEINKAAGLHAVIAEKETFTIMKEALRYSSITGGKFDPSIGPLVKAWNIGTDYAAVPAPDVLNKARKLVNFRKIKMDSANNSIFLENSGMKLDLGAIAKGYAADEMVRILKEQGINRAIVDLGGNIYALGEKAPGIPWTIGIRDPEKTTGNPILSLKLSNTSVVTSGTYERYFEQNGKRYHHILDPATGFPADNELLSVSIIDSDSMTADALSTSVFLLGTEKGMDLIERTTDTEAIFINQKHEVRVSSGLKGKVQLLDSRYSLMSN